MRINFFEEYPTEENIAKLEFVDWPATLFIATKSLSNFKAIRSKYSKRYPHITFGWWPIISGSYWISGFSNSVDIDAIFSELTKNKYENEFPILLDLELPVRNLVYLKNILKIGVNKKKIDNFLLNHKKYNLKIYTAEYPAIGKISHKLWKVLGLSPNLSLNHTRISMCYSSMGPKSINRFLWAKVKKYESLLAYKNPNQTSFGLGVIANGIFGNEKIIKTTNLKDDILWAKESGVSEIFIFRLGGLDESHVRMLK